jgi:hypothetical protein
MFQLLYATWFLLSVTVSTAFVVPRTATERLFASSSAPSNTRATRHVPLQMVDGLLQEAWTSYNIALEADPLLVKSVTACVILGAADLAGQTLEKALKENNGQDVSDNSSIDIARTVRFAFFGLVLQAPWNHFYYQFLDGVLPPTEEPFTATTGIKVVIDQFVQAPIFTVLIFAFLGLLEGKSLASVKQQLDNDYKDTMLANCTCGCCCRSCGHHLRVFVAPMFVLRFLQRAESQLVWLEFSEHPWPLSCKPLFSIFASFRFFGSLKQSCREIMGASDCGQSCLCPAHSASFVLELCLFLLEHFSIHQTQQGKRWRFQSKLAASSKDMLLKKIEGTVLKS